MIAQPKFTYKPKTLNEKIIFTRKQINILIARNNKTVSNNLSRKPLSNAVYHDQLEELCATLHKLKMMNKKDILDQWCELHPNDLECRIHDV